jgi:hypothetical protein
MVRNRRVLAKGAGAEGVRGRISFSEKRQQNSGLDIAQDLAQADLHGDFEYGGVTYRGSHQPLVTREVWHQVQAILDGRHAKKAGRRVFPTQDAPLRPL